MTRWVTVRLKDGPCGGTDVEVPADVPWLERLYGPPDDIWAARYEVSGDAGTFSGTRRLHGDAEREAITRYIVTMAREP